MLVEGKISLRSLRKSDIPQLTKLANNKNVWDNLRDLIPHPYLEKDAEEFIELTPAGEVNLTFGIEFEGELCGVIGLVPQKDVYRKSAEIGYWIGEPYWGKGIATIAVDLMTRYGLDDLNFARIFTGVFEYNIASMRVLEKNGYQTEGVAKMAVIKNGKTWDEHRFSITR